MGLASALSTALTGMTASETTIDVVGNNLANSNTVGFKASQASFATQFLQTQSLGSAPSSTNGGVDPRQIGLGTMVSEIKPNFNQGTIEISSNPTDLAIQGDGFFIVQGSTGQQLFTRNGMFKLNSQNQMVTSTGNRVLGYGVDASYTIASTTLQPINIPLGSEAVAQATLNAYLQGTLSPTGDLSTQGTILQTDVLDTSARSKPDVTGWQQTYVMAPPATPTAATAATPGSVPAGTYKYVLTYCDGRDPAQTYASPSESTASAASASVTLGSAGAITLSNLPTLAAGQRLAVYRTDATGDPSTMQLVTEIGSSDISSSSWTDTAASTVAHAPPSSTTAPTGTYTYYVAYATGSDLAHYSISRPTKIGDYTLTGDPLLLDDIPTAPPGSDWAGAKRLIYRSVTTPGDSSLYYVGELDGTTGPTSFIDSASDTSITSQAENHVMSFNGPPIGIGTFAKNVIRYNSTAQSYENLFTVGSTFRFTGRKGDRMLPTKEMAITDMTTVQNVLDFMAGAMGVRTDTGDHAGTNVLGSRMVIAGNAGLDNALKVDPSGMQLYNTAGTTTIDMPFNKTQDAVGGSAMTDFVAYNSLGEPLNVHITATLVDRSASATTYRWYADCPKNVNGTNNFSTAVGTGLVKFDGSGNFLSADNTKVNVYQTNSSAKSPVSFDLDFSQISGLAAASSTLAVSRQDGSAPGVLNSFNVGSNGLISGVFSNGITRDLGQIIIARFPNADGLQQLGQNMYAEGVNSGLPIAGKPNEQGLGSIVAGATELSNTDIGGNLVELITASTMYRGNARVVTTIQTLFDELLNLRR